VDASDKAKSLAGLVLRAGLGLLLAYITWAQFYPQARGAGPGGIAVFAVSIITLLVHEAGHAVLIFCGETLHILGGTFSQLLVPLGVALYQFWKGRLLAAHVALYWLGLSLMDVSRYVADARSKQLPLFLAFPGDTSRHDWASLLGKWGLLEQDTTIALYIQAAGWAVMGLAILLCFVPWEVFFAGAVSAGEAEEKQAQAPNSGGH